MISQDYFNKIIPTEFGNVNSFEIAKFDNSFLISSIYANEEDSSASVIMKINESNEIAYHLCNDFGLARTSLASQEDGVIVLAKDRQLSKAIVIGSLNSDLSVQKVDTIETSGEYNFPEDILRLNNSFYSSIIVTENEVKKIMISKRNKSIKV